MNSFEILVTEMRAAQREAKNARTLPAIKKAEALEADVDRELRAIKKAEAGTQPAAFTADLFNVRPEVQK